MTSLLLFGCAHSDTKIPEKSENTPTVRFDKSENIAGLGEACGGVDKKPCDLNYICEFTPNSADASGTCVDTVADKDIVCPEHRDPVCGIRSGQLNAFQNECQLNRHGAELVKKGFCTPDEDVADSCEAVARGIGTCFETFEAYEYVDETCQKKYVNGCEAEMPFASLEACESACE